jgi:hypothetical protein
LHITMPGGYEPNQAEVCTVTSPRLSGEVTARLLGDAGTVAPASFPMQPGVRQRLAVVPSATATGILRLELSMANGARQEVALYPLRTVVPRATDELIDGEVAGWPDASRLPCVSAGGTDAPTRAHLAWAADGLRFAVQMPSAYLTPGNPDSFWDSTNVELFVDPEAGEGDWSSSCRQFWFTPVREGDGWRMAAGQWRRGADAGSVPEDRCQVSIGRADGAVVFEGLVPTEAIGRTPETGELWRCAVSVHGIGPQGSIEAAWPRTKADGLVDGPGSWGMVVFE